MGHTICDMLSIPDPGMCFQDSLWHPLTYSSFLLDIASYVSKPSAHIPLLNPAMAMERKPGDPP